MADKIIISRNEIVIRLCRKIKMKMERYKDILKAIYDPAADDFYHLVAKCRRKQSSQMIYNTSCEHSKILFASLIQEAGKRKEDIRIVSGSLNDDFYGSLVSPVKDCIEGGRQC
ncbi:MAG: hypothetical protein Q8N12_05890 [Thermodesulfovibrionales bacterium]|nr:hypothetical protein [Nitrospinota bacterium]MCG2778494.1 hypothetical protein [Desulfobacterales bacterium]MDP3048949.1 hypothetical protein [Thermodesulfovibrionales bacterium]